MSARKFLRFLVHDRRIDIDSAKAVAIATMKPLAPIKELKSFIGKVSYIKRFIPCLASITSSFTKLLKKGQGFEWGGSTVDNFSEATADYDEPLHSISPSPQEAVTTLSSF